MQHNFRELKIWKDALVVVKSTYALCKELPSAERFGLIDQMQRCSVSIPSNIAEGSGRTSQKDFSRFQSMAVSSSYELETQLILSKDCMTSALTKN
jgi:four helix bundle protein